MENYIPCNQPMNPTQPRADQAADILLQQMQLLLDQSKQICELDSITTLGPNEKSRILCTLSEAITAGVGTIAELEKARRNDDVKMRWLRADQKLEAKRP